MRQRERLDRFASDIAGLERLMPKRPVGWERWSRSQQLEYLADLLIKESGGHRQANVLSRHQYKRRLRREVYSTTTQDGDLASLNVPITHGQGAGPGVFGRAYRPNPKSRRYEIDT